MISVGLDQALKHAYTKEAARWKNMVFVAIKKLCKENTTHTLAGRTALYAQLQILLILLQRHMAHNAAVPEEIHCMEAGEAGYREPMHGGIQNTGQQLNALFKVPGPDSPLPCNMQS